jgi:hypothetical protein
MGNTTSANNSVETTILEKAEALLGEQKYTECIKLWDEVLSSDPSNFVAYNGKVVVM